MPHANQETQANIGFHLKQKVLKGVELIGWFGN
jgi:hypothetical protein